MSYQTLLVQLELGRSNAACLAVARDLAKRLNTSVIGVAVAQPLQVLMGDNYVGAELVRDDTAAIESEAKAAEAEFRQQMNGFPKGIEWEMSVTPFSLSGEVASMAAAGDLLVAGLVRDDEEPGNALRRVDLDDLVMQAGRPVLAVPLAARQFAFGNAVVAWKDSREARRALADAAPLLRMMDKVTVLEIAEAGMTSPSEKILAWLSRQGIEAAARTAPPRGADGERLLDLAAEHEAELIVAGAYGHSRFGEWALGGVSRTLIHQARSCVLLSH